jgi:hypothetical protein
MRYSRAIIVSIVAVFVFWAYVQAASPTLTANGWAINAKGTGGSPVAVGTSTPVIVMDPASGPRCNWVWSWTEGGNLRCFAFPPQIAAPVDTPTATHGLIIQHGAGVVDNAVTGDPSLGWQCVSDSGTLNVSTAEFAHCLHKPGNP